MLTEKQLEAAALVAKGNLSLNAIAARVGCGARTLDDWKTLPEFEAERARLAEEFRDRVNKRGLGNRDRRLRTLDTLLRRSTGFLLHRTRMMEEQIEREAKALQDEAINSNQRALGYHRDILAAESELAGASKTDRKKILARIATLEWTVRAEHEAANKATRAAANLLSSLPMVRSGMARMEVKTIHVGKESYEKVTEFFYDRDLSAELRALLDQAAEETGQKKAKVSLENPDGTALKGITVTFVSAAKKDGE